MSSAYLLVNAGSSSLKLSLHNSEGDLPIASAHVDWSARPTRLSLKAAAAVTETTESYSGAAASFNGVIKRVLKHLPSNSKLKAVGHRVVHGGDMIAAQQITPKVLKSLEELSTFAPLHNPPSLETIHESMKVLPDIPHIAIFDTAFHSQMPPHSSLYAIPERWSTEWKIKRYGFHGLSYEHAAFRAAQMLGIPHQEVSLIVCHLGNGCSASAIRDGKSVDTTMGFTPLEGLIMATRSGTIDPGILLYLRENHDIELNEALEILNHKSGLLGVSGVSSDMRELLDLSDKGHVGAKLAIKMFCYRVQQAISALMVSLQKAHAIIFTAGIGENSPRIRELICNDLAFLGFAIDARKNNSASGDSEISVDGAKAKVLIIAAREDLSMLRQLRSCLGV